MSSFPRTASIALVCVGLGFGAAHLISGHLESRDAAPPLPPELRIDPADEPEEYLEAIVALETLDPAYDRSPGYLIGRRADRYVAASRLLTDRRLSHAGTLALERLAALRGAVDRFADELAASASAHVVAANGPHREIRAALSRLETKVRILALDEAEPLALGGSPDAAYLEGLEARIDAAPCEVPESLLPATEAKAAAADAKVRLKATLPALRSALRGLPEDQARPLEAELRQWVETFLPSGT